MFAGIFVGFINTVDNKITTHDTTILKRNKFKMTDNGTMLCCMVYVHNIHGQNVSITRSVQNKTLLIYQSHESTSNNPSGNYNIAAFTYSCTVCRDYGQFLYATLNVYLYNLKG